MPRGYGHVKPDGHRHIKPDGHGSDERGGHLNAGDEASTAAIGLERDTAVSSGP